MLNLELSWQEAAIASGCLFTAAAAAKLRAGTAAGHVARAAARLRAGTAARPVARAVEGHRAGAAGRPWLGSAAAAGAEAGTLLGLFALWQFAGSFSVLSPAGALPRARWIWDAERLLHLPSEAAIQKAVLPYPPLVQACNLYYAGLHFPVLIACLAWLFARHRRRYRRIRLTVAAFTAASLLIQLIPVAPPRMLPGDHMVDTAARYGQSVYGSVAGFNADQLSAMPSVHVGWALIVALAVIEVCRSRWRWGALGYPVLTTLVVVVTANHFWFDAIAAVLLVGAVLGLQHAGRLALAPLSAHPGRAAAQRRKRRWRLLPGRKLGQKRHRGVRHRPHRALDRRLSAGGNRLDPADLAHVLQRSGLDLRRRGRGLQPAERRNVAAHSTEASPRDAAMSDPREPPPGRLTPMPDPLTPMPERLTPMLAQLSALPPDDGTWALEMKWDGVRALAYCENSGVRLVSRTGQDITATYPELRGLAAAVAGRQALLDGEIVVLGPSGWPDFEALAQRMHVSSASAAARLATRRPVTYLAFDVLHLDGRPLLGEPYHARRALLESLALHGPHWQTPPSFTGVPAANVQAVSRHHDLEGVVAKRLESRYEPGRRTGNWRKIKNTYRQEAVVGGWRPGMGRRAGLIGSLLIGVHGAAGLEYAGHVGTGFTDQTLRMLTGRLAPLRRRGSPFSTEVPREHARDAVWVEPLLVVEVAFSGWTREGRMRAASYQGLRNDKPSADVVRE